MDKYDKYGYDIAFRCFHALLVGNGAQQVANLNEDGVAGRHVIMEQRIGNEILNHWDDIEVLI